MPFTFGDYKQFSDTKDPLALVTRGHLLVVDELDEILKSGLIDHKVFKRLVGKDVQNRADLALLCGFISRVEHRMFTVLNKVRNRCGHRKGYAVTTDDERVIYESLQCHNKYLGHIAASQYDPSRFPETLRICTLIVTMLFGVRAMMIKNVGPRPPLSETILGENLLQDWLGKDTLSMVKDLLRSFVALAARGKEIMGSSSELSSKLPPRREPLSHLSEEHHPTDR